MLPPVGICVDIYQLRLSLASPFELSQSELSSNTTLTPTLPLWAFLYFVRLGANCDLNLTCPTPFRHCDKDDRLGPEVALMLPFCANSGNVTREDEAKGDAPAVVVDLKEGSAALIDPIMAW